MPRIDTATLVIAIQAVDADLRRFRESVDLGDPEGQLMLEAWERAAQDLEDAYDVEARDTLNLPPYDELVGDDDAPR